MSSERQAAELVNPTGLDDGAVAVRPVLTPVLPTVRPLGEARPHRVSPAPVGPLAAAAERLAEAHRGLAEARTMAAVQRVMEAATVAAEAARRVARLAAAQGSAGELVAAANEAANEAAALRIEAQARAGELLRRMRERGERVRRGSPGMKSQPATSLDDLGVTRSESSRWQQVAAVPEEARRSYVEETKAAGGEVTTAGLLRHAASAGSSAHTIDQAAIHTMAQRQIRRVHQGLTQLHTYRPDALVAALRPREREELTATLPKLRAWVANVEAQLAAYRPEQREEVG